MFVEVRLYATLRRYVSDSSRGVVSVEVPEDYTVAQLLSTMHIDLAEVHIIMINGVSNIPSSILHEGDRLGLFPAVGGG
ncbi:MAG: MoaD/ThiS family protein [Sporomusaceae bacterium]|nr:MoaD/ThiS family protein [Sporomusaceae bacterium]